MKILCTTQKKVLDQLFKENQHLRLEYTLDTNCHLKKQERRKKDFFLANTTRKEELQSTSGSFEEVWT